MNKLLVIIWILSIGLFSTAGLAFDQNALDRLYTGDKNLAGANFSGANITYNTNGTDTGYHDIDFTGANFTNAYMVGRYFHNCNFTQTNFTNANLRGARFRGSSSIYKGANFSGSDLRRAWFEFASIVGVNFSNADLRETQFEWGYINTATNFNGATFYLTTFYHIKIHFSMKEFLSSQNIKDHGIIWTGADIIDNKAVKKSIRIDKPTRALQKLNEPKSISKDRFK